MEKIDIGHIKTSHRFRNGVGQRLRLFSKTQRKLIINEVENRPENWKIEDALKLYMLSPAVYYSWLRSEKKHKMNNLINNVRDIKTVGNKKTWIIEITAENEERAGRYLRMLNDCFEAAVTHSLPMDAATMSDPDRGEILTCKKI